MRILTAMDVTVLLMAISFSSSDNLGGVNLNAGPLVRTLFGQNFRFVLFGQNFRFVLGGLSRCFNCSIPRARFASYHHTRETLKRLVRAHSSLHRSLSLSLSHQSKFLSFRFFKVLVL